MSIYPKKNCIMLTSVNSTHFNKIKKSSKMKRIIWGIYIKFSFQTTYFRFIFLFIYSSFFLYIYVEKKTVSLDLVLNVLLIPIHTIYQFSKKKDVVTYF
jgi:hypothetical protein